MSLRDQLQAALGSAYTVERELGGGGMSRVFVARDEALKRNVVVKVLPPELLAGVNAERFDREIAMAAGLQHPHIVPVLTAGQMDGVPYYTMPFVDGESLRGRLTTEGALPITECIGILRDVAKALAYAHERGIVHRDIKPDNVLLSAGSAAVTDFGIAKALSAARTDAPGGTLTQIGTSLGTPAYISPEQAAADPATDHRADIYSFGCLAYEMIAGRPPFLATSPQRLLASQMAETPQPITELRPEVPPALAQLVMRCLAKDADDRPQRALEIVRVLETVASGGGELMPLIVTDARGMFGRALLVYAAAFIIVAVIANVAIVAVGLPDWVFPGALIMMALGLPVVLFTAYVHRARRTPIGAAPTYGPGGSPRRAGGTMAQIAMKASPYWSWRRAAIGAGVTVTSFVLIVSGYMVLRALGIGPAGSLFAAGALAENERILVAELPNPAGDSTLGAVVTEALRAALGESRGVTIMQPSEIRDALARMQRSRNSRVDVALAREISAREGIKAVVDGNLLGVGGRYVITLKLVTPQGGEILASFRESASSESEILPAIDKLARRVRAKIGESLRHVQSTPALAQVTTSSLEALKKYVQANDAFNEAADFPRGVALLEEAIALDTGFAMAYRKLSIEYLNRGLTDRSAAYFAKAYAHRDRLTEVERFILLGNYYVHGEHDDLAKAQAALEQALEIQPNNAIALVNLSNLFGRMQQWSKVEGILRGMLDRGEASPVVFDNLARTQVALGKLDSASATIDEFSKAFPGNPRSLAARADLLWARERYDSANMIGKQYDGRISDVDRAGVWYFRADFARLHGKIAEGIRATNEFYSFLERSGGTRSALRAGISEATDRAWFFGDLPRARRTLDDTLARHPIDKLSAPSVLYRDLVTAEVLSGRPERARGRMAEWEDRRRVRQSINDAGIDREMRARSALMSGRYSEAAAELREGIRVDWGVLVPLALLAQAYDRAGDADSAIVVFNRFIDTKRMGPAQRHVQAMYLPGVHKRLGELYEAKGDHERALRHYRIFIELWKDADPELQPKVRDARLRVAALTRGTDVRK